MTVLGKGVLIGMAGGSWLAMLVVFLCLYSIGGGRSVPISVSTFAFVAVCAAVCVGAGLELVRRSWFAPPRPDAFGPRAWRLLKRGLWLAAVLSSVLVFGRVAWLMAWLPRASAR